MSHQWCREINGVFIPESFEIMPTKSNYLLKVKDTIIKINFFNEEIFKNLNPNKEFLLINLKNSN